MKRRLSFAFLAVTLTALPAIGATRTWDGSSSALWSDAGNWGGTAPVAGDDLVFPTALNLHNTNDLAAGTTFHSITFTGGAYVITGNALALTNGFNTTAAGILNILNLPVTVAAPQTWSSDPSALAAIGSVNVNGQTLTLANAAAMSFLALTGSGAIIENGPGETGANSSTYTGTVTVNGGRFVLIGGSAGNVSVSGGELVLQSANVGTITATGGQLTLTHASSSGSLTAGPAAQVNVTLVPSPSSQDSVTGTVTLGSAALNVTSSGAVAPGTTLVLINNDGSDPVIGTFAGLPEGSVITAGGTTFRLSYIGGSGNDVTLTAFAAVPLFSPGALAALALAIVAIAFVVLRR